MKRRISALFSAVFVLLALCIPAAADGAACVFDEAGVLSGEDWAALDAQAQELTDVYGCGVYAAIVEDCYEYGSDVSDAAERIYADGGFGLGAQRDGIFLLLSLSDRDYSLYVMGENAKTAFSDAGRTMVEDAFLSDLGNDDWAGGLADYLAACGECLERAANGDPVRESPVKGILISVGVSCVIALVVCLILKSKMHSVYKGTSALEYVSGGGLELTDRYDHYTHTTETVQVIESDSDSSDKSGGISRSGKF